MSHCFIYIQPFHRSCVCLQSPYHAVIIRLWTKQYYLFVFILESSKRVSQKLITDTLSVFQDINNSENAMHGNDVARDDQINCSLTIMQQWKYYYRFICTKKIKVWHWCCHRYVINILVSSDKSMGRMHKNSKYYLLQKFKYLLQGTCTKLSKNFYSELLLLASARQPFTWKVVNTCIDMHKTQVFTGVF